MGLGHTHDPDAPEVPTPRRTRVALALALVPFAVATVIAMALLWPFERAAQLQDPDALATTENVGAVVVGVTTRDCGGSPCSTVRVRIEGGPDAGRETDLEIISQTSSTAIGVGQQVVVSRVELAAEPGNITYSYVGPQRGSALWLLAASFAVVVLGIARWKGLAALAGLAFTYVVIMVFIIPAILNGENPVAVALAGSSLVMFIVLYLAHGLNARTTTALLGTLTSLTILGVLAWLFVRLAQLSGTASEEVMFIQAAGGNLNLRGLLLAGIIIGSMGVLNDVTVTQASAIWELHRANPTRPLASLYRAGMRVGRDHIASVVDTLVLAYAGASLPLLILFVMGDRPFEEILTGEIVAEEVVRTLVGSMGLIASVPITTFAAAVIVARQHPPAAPTGPDEDLTGQDLTGESPGRWIAGAGAAVAAGASSTRSQLARRAERHREAAARRATDKAMRWEPDRREREFWDDV